MKHALGTSIALATASIAALATSVRADSTSGVDVALYRPAFDTGGIFNVEGARLMHRRDLALGLYLGYARGPIDVAVPGIGGMADAKADSILDYVTTLDMTFGMSLTDKLAIGFDVGAYRTTPGSGYGNRGRYDNGMISKPSTGLLSLRPLSNIDPSASRNDSSAYLGDEHAGPLDARLGAKYSVYANAKLAVAAVGTVTLPFGDEEMLLGDRSLVFEPKLAAEYRIDRVRLVANASARLRKRTVLEAYDTQNTMATADDAKVFLDVGSEVVAGVAGTYELSPRLTLAAATQTFAPLPSSVGFGTCHRNNGLSCSTIETSDYWMGASRGDRTLLATLGAFWRVSTDLTANAMIGTGQGGARGDDILIATGIAWSPQPIGTVGPSRTDRDGDGIPDTIDGCAEEPEDKDGFQDDDGCADPDNDGDGIGDSEDSCPLEPEDKDGFEDDDGCPERDNDNDTIPDVADKCPQDAEDIDGFEDDDGCPDDDNDKDGIKDSADKCPNDAESVNGFEDDDGCPDVRASSGPEETADRIDFKGQPVAFDKNNKLTQPAKALLSQVATILKNRKLGIRIEVHVALGTKSANAGAIKTAHQRDRQTAQARARQVMDFLVSEGVPALQLQAVGIGSDRPLGSLSPTDPNNDRVDLVKTQQGAPP